MTVALAPFARQSPKRQAANDPASSWEPYPDAAPGGGERSDRTDPIAAATRSAVRLRAEQVFEATSERSRRAATVDPARQIVSAPQYLRELEGFQRQQFQNEIANTVMTVTAVEVEQAIKLAARLRGRYLAKVLDAGAPNNKRPFGDLETKELARSREMAEEMQRGIEALRRAIESGELQIPGIRKS